MVRVLKEPSYISLVMLLSRRVGDCPIGCTLRSIIGRFVRVTR